MSLSLVNHESHSGHEKIVRLGPAQGWRNRTLISHEPLVSAQEWTNRTLAVHELTSVHFLVLPGSLSSITEITEYRYCSPLKSIRELRYESE